MDWSTEKCRQMQHMDIRKLKREELANAEDIVIDTDMCVEGRIQSFIAQTGNPFAQNVGEYILQVGFMEGAEDLIDDRMLLLAKRSLELTE